MSAAEPRCPKCGAPLPPGADVGGVCQDCVAAFLFESGEETRRAAPLPARAEELPAASRFGPYRVLSKLGQGGMGVVYLAEQTALGRRVALKVLPSAFAQDLEFAERFRREGRAMAALSHPNIVTIFDAGSVGGRLFYAMEVVEGPSLRAVLQAGPLAPEAVLRVVPQLCDALGYAHAKGIVHRDVKPENILIDAAGRVKLADFGLAKLARESSAGLPALTGTLEILGTPSYMAPEQMESARQVDHRADIYSLGAVIYEMLTGDRVVDGRTPPSRSAGVEPRWDRILDRALAEAPDGRYDDASELKGDVSRCSARKVAGARVLTSSSAAPAPRTPLLAAAAALAIALAFVAHRAATRAPAPVTPAAIGPMEPSPTDTAVSTAASPGPFTEPPITEPTPVATTPVEPPPSPEPLPTTPTVPNPTPPTPSPPVEPIAPSDLEPSPPAPVEREDDLKALDDEFGDARSLAAWKRLSDVERTIVDRFDRLEVDRDGTLVMVPSPGVWFNEARGAAVLEYRGGLLFKSIEGDFVVTARVRISARAEIGDPRTDGSVAGILVRAPRDGAGAGGEEYVFHGIGRMYGRFPQVFDVATHPRTRSWTGGAEAGTAEATLQLAHIGVGVYLLVKEDSGGWRVLTKTRNTGLPAAVQVGLTACTDWPTCQRLSLAEYDARVVGGGTPDLRARVDWVRFRRPHVPEERSDLRLDAPASIPDDALLEFLGDAPSGD